MLFGMLMLLLVALVSECNTRESFPERVRGGLERCCTRTGACDAVDCRLYQEFRDSYRNEALEVQCRQPMLYTMWPPHRMHSVRFDCLARDHFLARLKHDIRASEAQASALDAKEVQLLCIVDPRAIAHPQYRDTERIFGNGTRVREPSATTFLQGADADLLWRYLRAAAAPAAFSEIHVHAPRDRSSARVPCADGSRSLLTLNAAGAVRRLLPELRAGSHRQRSPLRVLAHVHSVDTRAHCVLCEYHDGMPRVKMKKFQTSVSVYPHHRRVMEPQRNAPPWARRDRLRARNTLWCAGYRALLALHRPQILFEGGVRYRPRHARRCHLLALGGKRVIKLVLGEAAELARLHLPAYALHVTLRWAATGSRWKPESVSVVRLGTVGGARRRRLTRTRWLPRRRAYYARTLALRTPAGDYVTIDTLGVEYFEDGTPERFSRSIDGKLDTNKDAIDVEWDIRHLAMSEKQNPNKSHEQNTLTMISLTTLLRTTNVDKLSTQIVDVRKSGIQITNMNKPRSSSIMKEDTPVAQITDLNTSNIQRDVKNSSETIQNLSTLIAAMQEDTSTAEKTEVNKSSIIIGNLEISSTLSTKVNELSKLIVKNDTAPAENSNLNISRIQGDVKNSSETIKNLSTLIAATKEDTSTAEKNMAIKSTIIIRNVGKSSKLSTYVNEPNKLIVKNDTGPEETTNLNSSSIQRDVKNSSETIKNLSTLIAATKEITSTAEKTKVNKSTIIIRNVGKSSTLSTTVNKISKLTVKNDTAPEETTNLNSSSIYRDVKNLSETIQNLSTLIAAIKENTSTAEKNKANKSTIITKNVEKSSILSTNVNELSKLMVKKVIAPPETTELNISSTVRVLKTYCKTIKNLSTLNVVMKEDSSTTEKTKVKKLTTKTTNVEKSIALSTKANKPNKLKKNKKKTNDFNKLDKLVSICMEKRSIQTINAPQPIGIDKLSTPTISKTITTNVGTSSTQTTEIHKPLKTSLKENIRVTNTAKTMLRDFFASITTTRTIDYRHVNMSFLRLSKVLRGQSVFDRNDEMPTIKMVLTGAAILLFIVIAVACTLCFVKMRRKVSEDPSGSVNAKEALGTAAAAKNKAGGALDTVVQSLAVAQGVTIALAARMLWLVWQAHQGASSTTTVMTGR